MTYFIRRKARENQTNPEGELILWSRHAIAELVREGWRRSDVEAAFAECEVIEDYPAAHRPLSDCLVLGWVKVNVPVHSVIAIDEIKGRLFVVTVYRPDVEEWENDWRTRK